MEILEWVRFVFVVLFLLAGISIFLLELFGVFRFRFVLNRMQAAATGDTLGIGLCMVGLILANGADFTSAKMVLVIVFLWFASPVSSHVIARLEYTADETLTENCRIVTPAELKEEEKQKEEEEQTGKRQEESGAC